jgi:hypothetical protein
MASSFAIPRELAAVSAPSAKASKIRHHCIIERISDMITALMSDADTPKPPTKSDVPNPGQFTHGIMSTFRFYGSARPADN